MGEPGNWYGLEWDQELRHLLGRAKGTCTRTEATSVEILWRERGLGLETNGFGHPG